MQTLGEGLVKVHLPAEVQQEDAMLLWNKLSSKVTFGYKLLVLTCIISTSIFFDLDYIRT